jgi:hypothetical protein
MGWYFLMIDTIIGTMGKNECLWVSPQKLIDGKNILRFTSYYYIIISKSTGIVEKTYSKRDGANHDPTDS